MDSYTRLSMPLEVHYHRRRVQEEILEQLPFGVITRNRAGCEILNVDRVMFMDWDIDVKLHLKTQSRGWFRRIRHVFAGPSRAELEAAHRECKQIRYQQLRDQFKDLRMLSARLYETHNGFRAIITSSLFDPAEEVAQALMREFVCDPLYARLCRVQGTFRARLTPKYWRLGLPYPFLERYWAGFTPAVQAGWLERYAQVSQNRAVCRFVAQFGYDATDPTIQQVIALHDSRCNAHSMLELA
jgi:hypothetical protein